jgi:transposase
VPTRKYARAPELLEHSRRIGRQFGLYEKALLQTEITEMRWLDDLPRWQPRTNRGDELLPRFVVLACGRLHRPQLPRIRGIRDFKGHSFHTGRWDYDYTGGDSTGGLPSTIRSAGHASDKAAVAELIQGLPSAWASVADPGYDAQAIIDLIRAPAGHAPIPTQKDRQIQRFVDPAIYRQRNLVERCFCKRKHFRCIATCFDRLARNFLAAVVLASIWSRPQTSSRTRTMWLTRFGQLHLRANVRINCWIYEKGPECRTDGNGGPRHRCRTDISRR